MLFAPMMRSARLALGLTQAEVARHLQCSQPQASRLESGVRCPSNAQLAALVELLGLDAQAAMAAAAASSRAAAAQRLRARAAGRRS